jgi:hypothetical protein
MTMHLGQLTYFPYIPFIHKVKDESYGVSQAPCLEISAPNNLQKHPLKTLILSVLSVKSYHTYTHKHGMIFLK